MCVEFGFLRNRIKYNCENGGPAPEKVTDAIYENTCTISSYKICNDIPTIDIKNVGATTLNSYSTGTLAW